MKHRTGKMAAALQAVRDGEHADAAAQKNDVGLNYLYQECKREKIALPVRGQMPSQMAPPRLRAGDRVRLADGRLATVCARVLPRDCCAYAIPDDMTRVVVIDAELPHLFQKASLPENRNVG